jgi:23S rRNA (uracil1939-C5)-methyltransferase
VRLCIHFGTCGGCLTQDMDPAAYAASKRQQVVEALSRAGVPAMVEETISVAPGTRRRAVFKVHKHDGVTDLGFHAARSHSIVDMRECLLLTPNLLSSVPAFRSLFAGIFSDGHQADLHVTDTETGLDISVKTNARLTPDITAALAHAASKLNLARVVWKKDMALELAAPVVRFDGVPVKIPPETFLQASHEGEALLQERVAILLKGAKHIADLFAGCGTFTLPLAKKAKVHAVELEASALSALAAAARGAAGLKPVTTEKRDLFKRPLTPSELKQYDAVLLDPPRAGASAQASQLGQSKIGRIAYVSCNAESFARDAAILIKAGYKMGTVLPVDQFLWSSHIELVAGFERP